MAKSFMALFEYAYCIRLLKQPKWLTYLLGYCIAMSLGLLSQVGVAQNQVTAQPIKQPPVQQSATILSANQDKKIEQVLGIKLLGIVTTASGHMLDFRFQVTNPKKAAPLVDPRNKPIAVIEKNGIKLEVPNAPRIGALRQTSKQIKDGMVFNILFANPGRMVVDGQLLTLTIGDFSVQHLVVGDFKKVVTKPHKRKIKHNQTR